MDLLNKEAKEFVLHNCYQDIYLKNGSVACEVEVSKFAIYSYMQYPFFHDNNKYIAYYKWADIRYRSPYKKIPNTLPLNEKCNYYRRRFTTNKGCFFSKDPVLDNKKFSNINSLDLAGDVITSLQSHCIKFFPCLQFNEGLEKKLKLQCFENEEVRNYFSLINNKSIVSALKRFCCVVGTIGNMAPFPEGTNTGHGNPTKIGAGDGYYKKLPKIEKAFYNKSNCNLINLPSKSFIKYWSYFFTNEASFKCFNDFLYGFCLNDYYDNGKLKIYSEHKVKEWLNKNTKLIIRRSLRIYKNGCKAKEETVNLYFKNLLEWTKDVNNNNS